MSEIVKTAALAPVWDEELDSLPSDVDRVLTQRNALQSEKACRRLYVRKLRHQKMNGNAEEQAQAKQALSDMDTAKCCQVLNVSLCFDGTNNHLWSELEAEKPNPTNVGRLFRASIGSDKEILEKTSNEGYFAYYINGLGTRFEEIGELGPSTMGLGAAKGGQMRINWGFTRLADALRIAVGGQPISDAEGKALAKGMYQNTQPKNNERGNKNAPHQAPSDDEYDSDHKARQKQLEQALEKYTGKDENGKVMLRTLGKPVIAILKLSIYGFSRGAAEARAFVNWLHRLCEPVGETGENGETSPSDEAAKAVGVSYTFFGVPIQIQFLGLLDTVASVGVAGVARTAIGHMDWADRDMALPDDSGFIKNHVHLVSAHEQRLCFPLDSVRSSLGHYPAEAGFLGEWVYPGMHSDVGGGYPNGDQGKSLEGFGMILSQIALRRLYLFAFEAGAPLRLDPAKISDPSSLTLEPWHWMDEKTIRFFDVTETLTKRFNAWVNFSAARCTSDKLEKILQDQTVQITAWRIHRYNNRLLEANFFKSAKNTPADAKEAEKTKYDEKTTMQADIDKAKAADKAAAQSAMANAYQPNSPGNPNIAKVYEATQDKQQLVNAAIEFSSDYNNLIGTGIGTNGHLVFDQLGTATKKMKTELNNPRPPMSYFSHGIVVLPAIITAPFANLYALLTGDYMNEGAWLAKNGKTQLRDLQGDDDLIALYDDHTHDSRAWFMVNDTGNREPLGSYFMYRNVIFNKKPGSNAFVLNRDLLANAHKTEAKELITVDALAELDSTLGLGASDLQTPENLA